MKLRSLGLTVSVALGMLFGTACGQFPYKDPKLDPKKKPGEGSGSADGDGSLAPPGGPSQGEPGNGEAEGELRQLTLDLSVKVDGGAQTAFELEWADQEGTSVLLIPKSQRRLAIAAEPDVINEFSFVLDVAPQSAYVRGLSVVEAYIDIYLLKPGKTEDELMSNSMHRATSFRWQETDRPSYALGYSVKVNGLAKLKDEATKIGQIRGQYLTFILRPAEGATTGVVFASIPISF